MPEREYEVSYRDPEGDWDEVTVSVAEDEDSNDAEEAARTELTAKHPSIDTDEWVIGTVMPLGDGPAP